MGDRLATVAQELAELKTVIQDKKQKGQEGDLNKDALKEALRDVLAEQGVGRKGEFSLDDTPAGLIGKSSASELIAGCANAEEAADYIYIASAVLKEAPAKLALHKEAKRRFEKAMDTATAGEGAEFIPTGFSSSLIEKVRLARKVAALHQRITMPTNPYKLPVEGGDATAYLQAEQTAGTGQTKIPESTPGTANEAMTAVSLAARVLVSREMEEDSIIPMLPYIRDKVVRALVDAEEEATINGDTTGTHQDSDVTASNDRRKAWKGYRKLALSAAKVDLATFNTSNLRSIRKAMQKYGVNPADLAWVVGLSVYNQMLGLAEVITLDKYGANATILSGELGKFDGIPIVVSEFVRENLNASGVYDGVTTTKTQLSLVYRPAFVYGDRRKITVEALKEVYAESGQDALIATNREILHPLYDETAERIIGIGYNITS